MQACAFCSPSLRMSTSALCTCVRYVGRPRALLCPWHAGVRQRWPGVRTPFPGLEQGLSVTHISPLPSATSMRSSRCPWQCWVCQRLLSQSGSGAHLVERIRRVADQLTDGDLHRQGSSEPAVCATRQEGAGRAQRARQQLHINIPAHSQHPIQLPQVQTGSGTACDLAYVSKAATSSEHRGAGRCRGFMSRQLASSLRCSEPGSQRQAPSRGVPPCCCRTARKREGKCQQREGGTEEA